MITIFDEPITILRYGAETIGANGLPSRPAPTSVATTATVERGTRRVVDETGPRYIDGISVLSFVELRDGDAEQGARIPADRIQWRGQTFEVVRVDYAEGFAGEPEHWEAFAAPAKAWGAP